MVTICGAECPSTKENGKEHQLFVPPEERQVKASLRASDQTLEADGGQQNVPGTEGRGSRWNSAANTGRGHSAVE